MRTGLTHAAAARAADTRGHACARPATAPDLLDRNDVSCSATIADRLNIENAFLLSHDGVRTLDDLIAAAQCSVANDREPMATLQLQARIAARDDPTRPLMRAFTHLTTIRRNPVSPISAVPQGKLWIKRKYRFGFVGIKAAC